MAATAIHGGTAPLAALTTIFRPPCPTSWLLTGTRQPSQLPMFPRSGPESCDPPSWSRNLEGGGFQYYSPAICPKGFIVGPGCGVVKTRTAEGFPAVMPGETVAYCVPVGMSCTTDMTDFRGGVWGWTRAGTAAGAAVTVGPAMQIRWVEADLNILETHPLTPGLRRQAAITSAGLGPDATPASRPGNDAGPAAPTPSTAVDPPMPPPAKTKEPGESPSSTAAAGLGSGWPLDKNTTAFLVVIIVVLVSVIVGILGLIIIRRHKAGKLTGPIGKIMDRLTAADKPKLSGKGKLADADEIEGAHLEHPERPLPPEPEYGPARGSTWNPAELDGSGVGERPRRGTGARQRPARPETTADEGPSMVVRRLSTVRESVTEERAAEMSHPVPALQNLQSQTESVLPDLQSPGRCLTVPRRKPAPAPLTPTLSPGRIVPPPEPSPLSPIFTADPYDAQANTNDHRNPPPIDIPGLTADLIPPPPGSDGAPTSPHNAADAARAMTSTGAWQPRLDRRQSWDSQEYKHEMQKMYTTSPQEHRTGGLNDNNGAGQAQQTQAQAGPAAAAAAGFTERA
ncbi:hypothetical protein QBC47DRAFT_366118 [Echria macrotheca]|uniref:Uncharacterized protein n=1 Tax=Echria macrotheca TaxID=438768 RepID=A0AAJ0B508_9PEZI|nr:hypothetical protein QBC47DRAFT_366118 [Echria macrotheca]